MAKDGARPTLNDVASLAEVSAATASVILSRREPQFSRHAKETIARVEEAASRVGYVPNVLAASLRRRQTPFFGVSFEFSFRRGEGFGPVGGMSAYMWEVFAGITRAAQADHRYPVFITNADGDTFADVGPELDRVIQSSLCGMIASVRRETWNEHVPKWEKAGIPCVSLLDRGNRDEPRWYVDLDNVAVGRLAWDYLSSKGHRHVLCLWDHRREHAQLDRLRGFRDAQTASGFEPAFLRLHGWSEELDTDDPRDEELLLQAMVRSEATAVFAVTGGTSMIGCRILRRRGTRIPEECSFLGIDVPTITYTGQMMTQITAPSDPLGHEAARLLARRIDGDCPEPTGVLVQPRVFERQSVARL